MIDMPKYNTAPSAPAAGRGKLFLDGNGNLATKNSEGIVSTYTARSDINPEMIYGIQYDKIADTITPGVVIGGSFVATDYQSFPVHEECGRGLLTSGYSWTKLNPYDTTKYTDGSAADLTGTDGQVMVRIPRFHQLIFESGDYQYFLLSKIPFSFSGNDSWVPLGFQDKSEIFIGAFQGVAATDSLTANLVSNITGLTYSTNAYGDPFTNKTRANYRSYAEAYGTGFHQWSYGEYEIIRMLFYTKYKTFNSQAALPGYTEKGSWDYSYTSQAGTTKYLGDFDGSIYDSTGLCISNNFLGIENIFGNVWQWVDGININGTDSGKVYVCNNPADFADDTTTNYTNSGLAPAFSDVDNYQKYMYATGKYCPFWCSELGGLSDTHITDYMWNQESAGWRVVLVGGSLSLGAQAGVGCLSANSGASTVFVYFGSRSAA